MPRDDREDTGAQKGIIRKIVQPMKVFLSENAFMGLLLSSAEVYKRESLGYLLGYRLDDRFIVEYAFSLQTAMRKRRGVIFHRRDQIKILPILSKFSKLQIVGDFHSHTPYGTSKGIAEPSPEDIKEMEEDNLYVIIAINEIGKSRSWKENIDCSISGSMGSFFFKISAYYYPGAKNSPRRAPIFCPFPPGLKVG
ncbi:MAG: Mov34/MPN/PAD-1 family protein [Nitrospiraceae bacterium]|nr:MAG: Mov34/MPN/PAD-1 family protein [Nitrospiraceae bacterium]